MFKLIKNALVASFWILSSVIAIQFLANSMSKVSNHSAWSILSNTSFISEAKANHHNDKKNYKKRHYDHNKRYNQRHNYHEKRYYKRHNTYYTNRVYQRHHGYNNNRVIYYDGIPYVRHYDQHGYRYYPYYEEERYRSRGFCFSARLGNGYITICN